MKQYELVVIYRPEAVERSEETIKKLTDMLAREEITVKSQDVWGKKHLAYPIKKLNDGYYVALTVESTVPSKMKSVTNALRNDDMIIRFMFIDKE